MDYFPGFPRWHTVFCDIVNAIVSKSLRFSGIFRFSRDKTTCYLLLKEVVKIHKVERSKMGYKEMLLICINQTPRSFITWSLYLTCSMTMKQQELLNSQTRSFTFDWTLSPSIVSLWEAMHLNDATVDQNIFGSFFWP